MFAFLTSALLTTLFAGIAGRPAQPAPVEGLLLSLVPEDSYSLVHCANFSDLRSRAQRNDWYRLLGSKHGEPLLNDLNREFRSQTHTELADLLRLGNELRGEALFFQTRQVAGFVTAAPSDRGPLAESMRAWLPEPGPEAVSRLLELGDSKVEMVAWPDRSHGGAAGREGHFAAFVDHPRVLGLFSGDDAESLMATLKASLGSLAANGKAPLVQSFESARGASTATLGLEIFIDFSSFAKEAEAELARSMKGVLPDPTGLLGIDQGLWLHSAWDVFPGTRVDGSARLNIPKGTLAARLADTFQPLPADLPARLPRGLTNLFAWRWNLDLFYQSVRSAFQERHGEESLQGLDQALEAAKSMSGVDPIREVVQQLDGTVAIYKLAPPSGGSGDLDFGGIGLLVGLVNGDSFLDSFERLVGGGPLESMLDLIELEGVDAYAFGEEEEYGGLAIQPRSLIVGFDRPALTRALRALNKAPDATLMDGSEFQLALDQNQGACIVTCQSLANLQKSALHGVDSESLLEPEEGEARGSNPFDSHVIFTMRRTADGLRFELHSK